MYLVLQLLSARGESFVSAFSSDFSRSSSLLRLLSAKLRDQSQFVRLLHLLDSQLASSSKAPLAESVSRMLQKFSRAKRNDSVDSSMETGEMIDATKAIQSGEGSVK